VYGKTQVFSFKDVRLVKILTIIGARPQFIKAAVVSRALRKTGALEIIVHTGQHYDKNMSDVFFDELHIPVPDYNLNIGGGSHGENTGRMIESIEKVLLKEKPEWVLVYGDTDSTLAGALAAKKQLFKVAHVEAGLRSFNMNMPEEQNRILTDRLSDLLFCPTDTAVKNLELEGYSNFKSKLIKSGDVMLDAYLYYSEMAKKPVAEIGNKFALCTIHRAENTKDKFKLNQIFSALGELSLEMKVVLPLHPRTTQLINKQQLHNDFPNLNIVEPVGYLEMIWLLNHCEIVLTDSGGLQKEAYFSNKNCVTLREETEWIELVESGNNILAGANQEKIILAIKTFEKNIAKSRALMFGKGNSSEIIINEILSN
jgi:UDP-GlcNAc3NAcA epimerase